MVAYKALGIRAFIAPMLVGLPCRHLSSYTLQSQHDQMNDRRYGALNQSDDARECQCQCRPYVRGDDEQSYGNYIPLARDAAGRNAKVGRCRLNNT